MNENIIDILVVTALDMYVEPDRVRQAGVTLIGEVHRRLGMRRCASVVADLAVQWRQPNLLFAQTCGYPLMTRLCGQVVAFAVSNCDLPDYAPGEYRSPFAVAERQTRQRLGNFHNIRLVLNGRDPNSSMNLLCYVLAPLGRNSVFFAGVCIGGGRLCSLAMAATGEVELASVDTMAFDYLQRHAPEHLVGLRALGRSAPSPALLLITSLYRSAVQRRELFETLNLALTEYPHLAVTLALKSFLPAGEEHYRILLDCERQMQGWGYPQLR